MSTLTRFFDVHDVYIETGIGHGQSLVKALEHGFKNLYAVEIDARLVHMAEARFAGRAELTIHHGSSPDILPRVIDPKRETLFWLDAHYSAGLYTGDSERDRAQLDPRYGECPLLAELEVIVKTPWKVDPLVLIDDAACFLAPVYEGYYASWDRGQHPTLEEIHKALPGFSITPRDDGTGQYFVCRSLKGGL